MRAEVLRDLRIVADGQRRVRLDLGQLADARGDRLHDRLRRLQARPFGRADA